MVKKKERKKKKFGLLKIILTIIVLTLLAYLYLSRGAKVEVSYDSEFLLGQPFEMSIDTYDNFRKHSPESLTVSISNRYNQNESFSTELVPYEEGSYQLLITPSFAGEYTVNIKYQDEDVNKTFSDSFLVK